MLTVCFVEVEIMVTLDSGCCEHVLDLEGAPGYQEFLMPSPGSIRKQNFVVGNGQLIPNEGQVQLNMQTQSSNPESLSSVLQVAEVTRPLMSASRICDQGFVCIFDDAEALW